jgi:hypothetical protein
MKTATKTNLVEVPTYAPLFPGFYNTLDSSLCDDVVHNHICDCNGNAESCGGHSVSEMKYYEHPDYYEIVRATEEEYGREFLLMLADSKAAKELELSFTYKKIWSPKEYNFKTDAIDCTAKFNPYRVLRWLNEYKEEFAEYVRRNFTSYDGFMSYYSNDIDEWFEWYGDFLITGESDSARIGSILEFLLGLDEEVGSAESRYYAMCDKIY